MDWLPIKIFSIYNYKGGTLAILSVPVVHQVPVHPVAQLQELGAIHVPPFGHDVAPEHRAETQIRKIKIEYCSIKDRYRTFIP